MKIFLRFIAPVLFGVSVIVLQWSCKSCNKKTEAVPVVTDSLHTNTEPQHQINLEHADTSLIPIMTAVLEEAFAASEAKDYNKLAKMIVYRGTDMQRHGYDVFNAKSNYERGVVRLTGEVFKTWKQSSIQIDYARAFEWPQPDGRSMMVMEVIFVSKRSLNRKYFGFLPINNEYKIADVTSYI